MRAAISAATAAGTVRTSKPGPRFHAEMGVVEEALPVAPRVEPHELVGADRERERRIRAFALAPAREGSIDRVGRAVVLDFLGGDACRDAFEFERRSRGAGHREPVMRRRHIALLPRLAGGQQHELGQLQQLGEAPREREVSVVNRIERAAEQADASRAKQVRIRGAILFPMISMRFRPSHAAPGNRCRAALPACRERDSSYSAKLATGGIDIQRSIPCVRRSCSPKSACRGRTHEVEFHVAAAPVAPEIALSPCVYGDVAAALDDRQIRLQKSRRRRFFIIANERFEAGFGEIVEDFLRRDAAPARCGASDGNTRRTTSLEARIGARRRTDPAHRGRRGGNAGRRPHGTRNRA